MPLVIVALLDRRNRVGRVESLGTVVPPAVKRLSVTASLDAAEKAIGTRRLTLTLESSADGVNWKHELSGTWEGGDYVGRAGEIRPDPTIALAAPAGGTLTELAGRQVRVVLQVAERMPVRTDLGLES